MIRYHAAMRSRLGPLSLALLTLLASGARADDIGPPPNDCPRGALGHSEHAGEWCAVTTCATDANCTGAGISEQISGYWPRDAPPLVCGEATGLCVIEETYELGGLRPTPAQGQRRVARGPCVGGTCPAGGECRTARRCVPPDTPPVPVARASTDPAAPHPSESGAREAGGCVAGAGARRGGGVWLVLGLGGLLLGRRPLGVARRRR